MERTPRPRDPRHAALMNLAIRRAGAGRRTLLQEGESLGTRLWLPLRSRDPHPCVAWRTVCRPRHARNCQWAARARSSERPFRRLPAVMARAAPPARAESIARFWTSPRPSYCGQAGKHFCRIVTAIDERGAKMQLCDRPGRHAGRGPRSANRQPPGCTLDGG